MSILGNWPYNSYYTGCLTVSVRTLIDYFSAICKYYGISFKPLNCQGGGFCLRYETPWYMQRCLRKMQNEFLADFQFLWFLALFWILATDICNTLDTTRVVARVLLLHIFTSKLYLQHPSTPCLKTPLGAIHLWCPQIFRIYWHPPPLSARGKFSQ